MSVDVSPDGSQIAYLGYNDLLKSYQQADLYVMNADGSGAVELALSTKANRAPGRIDDKHTSSAVAPTRGAAPSNANRGTVSFAIGVSGVRQEILDE